MGVMTEKRNGHCSWWIPIDQSPHQVFEALSDEADEVKELKRILEP